MSEEKMPLPTAVQGVVDTLLPPPSTPHGEPPATGDVSSAIVTSILVMGTTLGVVKDWPWLSVLVRDPTFAAFLLGLFHFAGTMVYQRFSGPRTTS